MKPHPLRTHRAAWPLIIAAALLALLPSLRAGTVVDPPGSLRFSLEVHSGKSGEIHVHLNAKGFFMVHSEGTSTLGNLPAVETLRIFAEFEKLCTANGVEGSPTRRGRGGRLLFPCFHYESPQGKILFLEGRDSPPPPALTAFLITLSQKLLHHAAKKSGPAAPAPPAPPTRTF